MNDVSTRPATEEDKDFVWQLSVLCYQDVVIRQFGPWDQAWQLAHFEKHWCPEKCSIVLREDIPVGILSTWQENDALFLSQILIHPDHQNQGLGSSLLRGVMAQAQARGLPVRLQVLKENKSALSLYQRLEFTVFNTTDIHYQLEWKG